MFWKFLQLKKFAWTKFNVLPTLLEVFNILKYEMKAAPNDDCKSKD